MNTVVILLIVINMIMVYNVANAHLCIFNPHQRGELDISGPSGTCFRPYGPCGKQSPETPVVEWEAGSKQTIHFQQNLNHYTVGFPGYFDIAISPEISENQDDYQHIDFVRDVYFHRELHQHNFTYELTVPDINTDHGVIQMRYISHKPGEPIFHQCFDVKITPSRKVKQRSLIKSQKSKSVYAIAYNPNVSGASLLVRLNEETSKWETITEFPGIVATSIAIENGLYSKTAKANHEMLKNNVKLAFIEDLVAYEESTNSLTFFTSDNPSDPEVKPSRLFKYQLDTGRVTIKSMDKSINIMTGLVQEHLKKSGLSVNDYEPVISSYYIDPESGDYVSVVISGSGKGYQWFVVSASDTDGRIVARGDPEEQYYINYLWSSVANGKISFILRNEHAPFNMTQMLYTVDLKSGATTSTHTDVTESFSCHHWDNKRGILGMSVGSYNDYLPTPHVVTNRVIALNPSNGNILDTVKVHHIQSFPYQGGCVHRGAPDGLGIVYHRYSTVNNRPIFVKMDTNNQNEVLFHNDDTIVGYLYNMIVV